MSNCLSPAQRIHALGRFSGKAGLHRIRALCQALGNPQDRLKFIHIAGTNGKGSTATMLASVLKHAGYQTGLYTSPYLVVFNERIRVNDTMISDRDLSRLFDVVQKVNCTPFVRQYVILDSKRGVLLWQKGNQISAILQN